MLCTYTTKAKYKIPKKILLFSYWPDCTYTHSKDQFMRVFISSFSSCFHSYFDLLHILFLSSVNTLYQNMDRISETLQTLSSRTTSNSDYPHATEIKQGLIPVFDAKSLNGSYLVEKLLLQEVDINDPTSDPTDHDLEILSELCEPEGLTEEGKASNFLKNYRHQIEEIVHSLSLEGPGVCIVEDVFSEEYMEKFQSWVDDYLTKDTSSKKDHFAFGTNKRIWRLPEKLPPSLLYSYLRYDASSSEDTSPVFNHVIDRSDRIEFWREGREKMYENVLDSSANIISAVWLSTRSCQRGRLNWPTLTIRLAFLRFVLGLTQLYINKIGLEDNIKVVIC